MPRRRRKQLDKVERRSDKTRQSRRRAQNKWRWVFGGVAALVVLLALGLGGAYWWFRGYLASEDLRSLVEQQLGQKLEARVELSPQEWSGSEVQVDKTTIRGSGKLEAMDVLGFNANLDLGQLWNRLVDIRRVSINQLQVTIDQRTALESDPAVEPDPALPPAEAVDEAAAEPSSFAPRETRIGKIDIGRGSLRVRSDFGDYLLENTRARIEPFEGNIEGRRISLSGGSLSLPIGPFPEVDLVTASLRRDPKSTYLSSGDLRFGKRGHLSLSGEWRHEDGAWRVTATGDTIEIDELVPATWQDSLAGLVEFNADGLHHPDKGSRWQGDVRITKGRLGELALLDTLAAYTRKPEFQMPALEEAEFRFHLQNGQLKISEINLYSRNLARIEGTISIEDDVTRGTLMVGIPSGTLSFIPGAETKVFRSDINGGKYGWLWTPVRIEGRRGTWTEDLTRRLIEAAGDRMFEIVPETGERVLKFTRRAASEILRDPVKGGLDSVEEGTRLIDDTLRDVGGGLIPGLPLPPRRDPGQEPENEGGESD